MINKFLKLGGVKTEEEFYRKYPTEEIFFYNHPNALKQFQSGSTYLEECPEGYIKDETGECVPDNGYNPTQEQQKGMPIVPMKNTNGVMVGGTGATIAKSPYDTPPAPKPKMRGVNFNGTGIAAGMSAISFGLNAFSNTIEEARKKKWAMGQMANNFNGTYANAQNDYGVDPYEQTGQFRPQLKYGGYQQGGKFDILDYIYGDDEDDITTKPEASIEKKKAPRITEEDIDQLVAIGLSPEDMLKDDGYVSKYRSRKNKSNGSYKKGGTYDVDFATIMDLKKRGIKFKIL